MEEIHVAFEVANATLEPHKGSICLLFDVNSTGASRVKALARLRDFCSLRLWCNGGPKVAPDAFLIVGTFQFRKSFKLIIQYATDHAVSQHRLMLRSVIGATGEGNQSANTVVCGPCAKLHISKWVCCSVDVLSADYLVRYISCKCSNGRTARILLLSDKQPCASMYLDFDNECIHWLTDESLTMVYSLIDR